MTLVKMLVFVILLLPQYLSPSEIDYCTLNCKDIPHVVCERKHCKTEAFCRMEEMTTDIRNWIVEIHNNFRSQIALGKNPNLDFKVSNMMRINYDMELEYIAQCWANVCKSTPNKCVKTQRFPSVGQIVTKHGIYAFNKLKEKDTLYKFFFRHIIENELKDFDEENFGEKGFLDKSKSGKSDTGLVAQLMNAISTHIGCGISSAVAYDENNERFLERMIVCNYANAIGPKKSLLLKGDPCSQCQEKICNSGLCGRTEPIPTDDSYKRIYPNPNERPTIEYDDDKNKSNVPKLFQLLFLGHFLSLLLT